MFPQMLLDETEIKCEIFLVQKFIHEFEEARIELNNKLNDWLKVNANILSISTHSDFKTFSNAHGHADILCIMLVIFYRHKKS